MNNALEIRGLYKTYRGFKLGDLSFDLPQGYIMGLIGPNGAGKTTTFKAIMNFINIDGGEISVLGYHHQKEERMIKKEIGYVGEEQNFYPEMTCRWTAGLVAKQYPTWDDDLYNELMDKFSISQGKKIKELSRGNRVKFALVLALAHRPRLLLLDEPTSGLDPIVRSELLVEMLEVIQQEDRSILFSSHITEDLQKICDYITFINEGRLLLSDSKENIMSCHKKVLLTDDLAAHVDLKHFIAYRRSDSGITGVTRDYREFNRWAESGRQGNCLTTGLSLDQLLICLVKGEV